MPELWYLFKSGPNQPATNMAVDQALLEWAATWQTPVLRFYGWSEPAATFGYSQRFEDVARWTRLRPLIRRPTGGGLVPHDADWTYSLTFPPGHPWYQLKAVESYRRAHEWVARAFSVLGVQTTLAPQAQMAAPGQCFVGAERFDVLAHGAKIAGAAQRRNRSGLLIQGSVQPRVGAIVRTDWERAMLETLLGGPGGQWRPLPEDGAFRARAEWLALESIQNRYNERR